MIADILLTMRQAFGSLSGNKLRSLLTMLGIIIGISSVIVMLSAGQGAQQLLVSQVEDLGSNVVYMYAGGDGGARRGPPAAVRGVITKTMKLRDVEELQRLEKNLGIRNVSGFTSPSSVTMKRPGEDKEIRIGVQGRDRAYFTIRDLTFAEGALWSADQEASLAKVAVIGANAKDEIFGENAGNVVGESLRIKGQTFRIVGVLELSDGGVTSLFGQGEDDTILVPPEVAQKYLLGIDYLSGLMFEAVSAETQEASIERVADILRENHKIREGQENDFSIRSQDEIIEVFTVITSVFSIFLASIAAISLFVGGIGIMNIMLVSVTERTKEIGLKKALGAPRRSILLQFIIESLVLTLVGGAIGIVLGLLGSWGIALLGGWDFFIDGGAVLLAVSVSAAFGLVFGFYPAWKASKLDPIDALRYE